MVVMLKYEHHMPHCHCFFRFLPFLLFLLAALSTLNCESAVLGTRTHVHSGMDMNSMLLPGGLSCTWPR